MTEKCRLFFLNSSHQKLQLNGWIFQKNFKTCEIVQMLLEEQSVLLIPFICRVIVLYYWNWFLQIILSRIYIDFDKWLTWWGSLQVISCDKALRKWFWYSCKKIWSFCGPQLVWPCKSTRNDARMLSFAHFLSAEAPNLMPEEVDGNYIFQFQQSGIRSEQSFISERNWFMNYFVNEGAVSWQYELA